jgi:hypothetical protein
MPTAATTLAQPLRWVDGHSFGAPFLSARASAQSAFAEVASKDVTEREKCAVAPTTAQGAGADDHIRCDIIAFPIQS